MRLYDIIGKFRWMEECEIIVINNNYDCIDYFNATDKKMRVKYKDCEVGMMEIVNDGDYPCVRIEVLV